MAARNGRADAFAARLLLKDQRTKFRPGPRSEHDPEQTLDLVWVFISDLEPLNEEMHEVLHSIDRRTQDATNWHCAGANNALPVGSSYVTVETKTNFARPITRDNGRVRAEARVGRPGTQDHLK
jgi:hypothetical protein